RCFPLAPGRSSEPQEAVAYYACREGVAALYAGAPAWVRATVPRRWPDLLRLLPDQAVELPAERNPDAAEDQPRLFWQVTSFVEALAARQPVALLLDDLHWADFASLALLQHLARQTRNARVLLLGACRDVEVRREHPLEAALRDLGREKLISERVAVRRLPVEGTAALAAATVGIAQVSDELAQHLRRRTDGNAFFTREVVRALIERGDLYQEGGRWQYKDIGEI